MNNYLMINKEWREKKMLLLTATGIALRAE